AICLSNRTASAISIPSPQIPSWLRRNLRLDSQSRHRMGHRGRNRLWLRTRPDGKYFRTYRRPSVRPKCSWEPRAFYSLRHRDAWNQESRAVRLRLVAEVVPGRIAFAQQARHYWRWHRRWRIHHHALGATEQECRAKEQG